MTGCKVKQVPATSFHLFVCTYESAAFNHRSTQHFFPESHLLDNMASIPIAKNQYFVVSTLSRAPQLYDKP